MARSAAVRGARARCKRDVAAGRALVADILAAPEPEVAGMRLSALLEAVRGLGPERVARLLVAAGIAPCKTVGGLTPRQRREVLTRLPY